MHATLCVCIGPGTEPTEEACVYRACLYIMYVCRVERKVKVEIGLWRPGKK